MVALCIQVEVMETCEPSIVSMVLEMEVDDGIRKKSLHPVGAAEAVSPARKVEPERVMVAWRRALLHPIGHRP